MEGGSPGDFGNGNRLTLREVRWAFFRTKEGFFILFGSLFGGIPTVIAVVLLVTAVHERGLLQDGAPATATIMAKRISSDSDSTTYRLFYEFVAADGRTYGGDYSVDNREFYSKNQGDRFEIRYSRENPFNVAVVGHQAVPMGFIFPFLSIFMIIGGAFLFFGIRGILRHLRVYKSGLEIWGKNLGIQEDPSMKVNGRACRVLEFEFTDMMGQLHRCRSSYLNEKLISRLEAMAAVPIVYLQDRPDEADLNLDRL